MAESGISATCKKIAENFVKVIIAMIFITLFVWIILIDTETVKLDKSAAKYAFAFERVIGVLVV